MTTPQTSKYRLNVLVATFVLAGAAQAWATQLYGISFISAQGSVLYDVDQQTGQASNPRLTGLDHMAGIAFGAGGTLYGLTNASASSNPNSLVRIDPMTGTMQVIGSVGANEVLEGDLAFDRSTGTLYGAYQSVGDQRLLFTVNVLTAAATPLPASLYGDPSALAFDAAGNLYAIDTSLGMFNTLDKATGNTLTSTPLSQALGSVAGMAIDPANGTFYVVDGDSDSTNNLYTLNPTTGVLTVVGPTTLPDGLAGLAFVPEPTSLALAAIGAAFALKRRRVKL